MRPRQLRRTLWALTGLATITGLILGVLIAEFLMLIGIGR